jgi:anti-sigma factor ChrR (cupin superfamily)
MEVGAGATYPAHDHAGYEELYVLSGDLETEGRLLGPGDFLHAEPGSHHNPLHSPHGCTALLVVPREAVVSG